MHKKLLALILCALMLFPVTVIWGFGGSEAGAEELAAAEEYLSDRAGSMQPKRKADGKAFSIAYVDIDPYPPSGEMVYYFVEKLREYGWIDCGGELPFDPRDTNGKELISYLADHDKAGFLDFDAERSYYLAVDGEELCRESLQAALDRSEVDLILCLGTWPGTFAASLDNDTVPVMVYFSVDPVGGGLSAAEDYSGRDNLWCHVNYNVYSRQIQFYYDNAAFQKIGMVYYDENVAAMRAYREVAEQNEFSILEQKIHTLTGTDEGQIETYYAELSEVFQGLVEEGIDAFMLSTDIIKDVSRIRPLLQIFYRENIPVFVQNGEYFVENGALMVVTASDAQEQAPFAADVFARILNGEKPGSIHQVFMTPPYLSINLGTADRIGYQVQEELILSAEKIYTK